MPPHMPADTENTTRLIVMLPRPHPDISTGSSSVEMNRKLKSTKLYSIKNEMLAGRKFLITSFRASDKLIWSFSGL